jgi:predicted CopG family antitoxin
MAELKYKKLQSRVTQKVYTRLRRLAKKREMSISKFIRELILAELKNEEALDATK